MKLFALALLAAPAVAQMGRRNTGGDPRAGGQADVDMAMAGWEQLSQNPDKMAEVMASLQDPEVAAKAQEMLKDPEYMRAAKAKVAELQAKAQQNGLLDANGQPVPNNMANMMAQMGLGNGAGMPGAGAGAGGAQARDWEAENIARHRSGELNDAELGMANLKKAMGDPGLMSSIREMMKDPNTMAEVQKMMANPAFQAQAEKAAQAMKGGGMDFSALAQQMGATMGGGAGAGGAAAEIERLKRENAMLKQHMSNKGEL